MLRSGGWQDPGMRSKVLLGLVVLLMLAACGGGRGAVPDRFSGTWRLADGRTIPIRRVSDGEGQRSLRALGGAVCPRRAVYYRATYFGGVAHMAGCASGDGRVLRGRFDDNGITGTLVQRLVGDDRFVGIVHGDGHAPFRVTAARAGG
jgi:hypothetical protein